MDLQPLPGPTAEPGKGANLLLTVEEAAVRLRMGRTKLYSLIATGEVESVTVGRLRRVPAGALADYVTSLREGAKAA